MADTLSIRRDAFDFLLDIVENPWMGISGAVLDDYYPHLVEPLIGGGWFIASGALNMIIDGEDDQPFHELEWDPDHKQYRYFARSLGWIYVAPSRLKSYVVNVDRFLELLCHHLDIPRSHRTTCLHEGLLWHLGPARFGGARAHLYFARCLENPRNREPLCRAMDLERGKTPAIILHGGRTDPTWLDLPVDRLIVPTRTVCGRDGNNFSIDGDVIRAALGVGPDPKRHEDLDLRFSAGFRIVYWHGNEYKLTKTQAAIVECLHEEGGRAHKSVLSAAADTDQTVQRVMRNRRKGSNVTHPLYGTLIKADGNGFIYFDREAPPPDG